MTDIQLQSAILIFANTSEKDVIDKSIPNGKDLFDRLNTHTFEITTKAKLPVFLISEDIQRGDNFGERFANAITDIFSKGYEQIITVGNDSPDLKTSDILEAHFNLISGNSTIGPSADGGTYLIGIHKHSFNKKLFTELPWQTSFLRQALHSYLIEQGSTVKSLSYKQDIDSYDDLKYFLDRHQKITSDLRQILLELTKNKHSVFSYVELFQLENTDTNLYNKGSPY
ncbi:TIGR04282 family arsenosugar biosynthesis glycosyltransferase [Pseudotenacibaculum haliotis]|uniref:DUF2064 domain-containing protein n=1 Tax=Pseudotenacibaculum haliotis TaxID=1862138 RepID=A0ABW5LR37_9FLAO